MTFPTIEIIALGSEILRGEVQDLTAGLLSERLSHIGTPPRYQTTVGDDERTIKEALLEAFSRADCIILIGGLGPTFDDITRSVVASFFSSPLIELPGIRRKIKQYFKKIGRKPSLECLSVARIPKGSRPIKNRIGLAPGFFIRSGAKSLLAFPGVPAEATTMFDEKARPILKRLFPNITRSRRLLFKVVGLSETEVLRKLKGVLRLNDPSLDCGIYPKTGEVHLRVALNQPATARDIVRFRKMEKAIEKRLKRNLFAREEVSLEEAVGRILRGKRKTLALAESCTGGLIAKCITDVPGASDYFLGGVVTYSNESKETLLGIPRSVVRRSGAVSRNVARLMAQSVRLQFGADIGAAVTGIAGPTGGTRLKPVGTVWIAVSSKSKTIARKVVFSGGRSVIRRKSSRAVFQLLLEEFLKRK